MSRHEFEKDLVEIEKHYESLFTAHGDSPAAMQWSSRASQERRMRILSAVGDISTAKLLDFGCGTGHLLNLLRAECGFTGEYVGYDLCENTLDEARRKFPQTRFERRDVLADGMREDFDYVLINGVFNNQVSDNWRWMTATVRELYSHVRCACAFNALSTYVDYQDQGLFYVSPERVFRFCKEELSPCVTLRHDYCVKDGVGPFEFSVYVYRTEFSPKRHLEQDDLGGQQ